MRASQRCIDPACAAQYSVGEALVACRRCGALLDVVYQWPTPPARGLESFSIGQRVGYPVGGGQPGAAGGGSVPSAGDEHLDGSGVWRFRALLPFYEDPASVVSIGEGRTVLQRADLLADQLGLARGALHLQYEGLNPSGSFKDNGMTAAFTHARMVGARVVACASTGNTSASMAVYAAQSGAGGQAMRAVIFIGQGKVAYGKLSQALDYGALTLQVAGDFDACLARVRFIAQHVPEAGVYLMNSVNPFRLEGQKTVMYRVMEGLGWRVPDWVIVPGGNLGNCSAFGKAFMELRALGLTDRVPRLAVINAQGAATLDRVYNGVGLGACRWNNGAYFHDGGAARVAAEYARMDAAGERARTIATAIEINRPVNLPKALRALEVMSGQGTAAFDPANPGGVVRRVDDDAVRHFKAMVGRYGFGCEPASAASVAGAALLRAQGLIKPEHTVVCVLTGHALKDPDVTVSYHTGVDAKAAQQALPDPAAWPEDQRGQWANPPVRVPDRLGAILRAMGVEMSDAQIAQAEQSARQAAPMGKDS